MPFWNHQEAIATSAQDIRRALQRRSLATHSGAAAALKRYKQVSLPGAIACRTQWVQALHCLSAIRRAATSSRAP